ncbi:hypothetical protein EV177_006711 [Coemansia sp. RSA 1804]|nr:hypothetical protein EV177_006711 [Coemansia sp. RSA 1804]
MYYIFNELEYYKVLQENTPQNMKLGGADMVWFKDTPDYDSLALELKQYAAVLEAAYPKRFVNQDEGGRVLRLIDPLLYPLDYELTRVLSSPIESPEQALNVETFGDRPGSFKAWADIVAGLNPEIETDNELVHKKVILYYYWFDFCWLPTDIRVDMDGSVVIKSYINNLHPAKHAAFYKILSRVLEDIIPLAEQVLADLLHPTCPRVIVDKDHCIKLTAPLPEYVTRGVSIRANADFWNALDQGIVYTEPVPQDFTKPDRPLPLPPTYSLRGEELQVVIGMETTYLTSDNPKHGKSEWQNSGNFNDKIVATAIWYYDVENVDISDIQFRDPVGTYEQHNMIGSILEKVIFHHAYKAVYEDIGQGYGYSQPVGTTGITSGRVVCFPNSYQHLEPSVELADPSQCGHVRKLYFHLVHPGIRILSTSIVAPQQQEWWAETAFSVPPLNSLPAELQVMIQQRVDEPMSLEEAYEEYAGTSGQRRPLPQRTFVSVEYPGFVNNVETAIKTMGGREKLARVVTEDIGMPVELRYRHNDLVSHPINGNVVATQNLLIKVKRRTRVPKRKDSDGRQSLLAGEAAAAAAAAAVGPVETSAEVVGIIDKTVRFRSLADFQFVPAPSDPLWGFTDMLQSLDLEKIKEAGEGTLFDSSLDTRNAYIPAPFLDRKGWPSQTPLKSHASDLQKGAEEGTTTTREKKAASSSKSHLPFHGIIIKYSSPTVPTEASEKAMQCAGAIPEALLVKINGILEKQPVVSRNAMKLLISRSELDGMLLNVVMATVSYLMESGPWRSCWIRFGYDPRQHEEACKYQILDMRTLFAKENIGRRRGNMPETSRSQQAPKQPRNPVQAQSYIYDMEAARQGIAGIFQLINVDIPILNELIEYPGGRRRSSCEKSGWLHISLSNTIRRKSRLLKQSLDGSANAAKDLPIDHAELENMLRADRRNEKADAAIETMVREREASARGGQLSQTMRSHVDAHVEQLMSQLAAQGNVLAEASNGHTGTFDSAAVYDGDGIGDGNGDFDDYNIFGEEEPSDDED